MPYSPPVGTVPLALTGSYSPPTGTAPLALGGGSSTDRTLTLAGDALAPTGLLRIIIPVLAQMAGESLAPTGRLELAYDPNLLSAVQAKTGERWQPGIGRTRQGAPDACPISGKRRYARREQAGRRGRTPAPNAR